MSANPEPPQLPPATRRCELCGQHFPELEMMRMEGRWFCPSCKPVQIQRLKEGVPNARPAFRDLTGHTWWLRTLLIASAVIAGVAFVSDLLVFRELKASGGVVSEDLSASDIHQGTVGMFQLGLMVATAFVFGRWIYFANANARALGAVGMRFTPGWSVGWYFVPIANLWKPYQAMKEIWQASVSATHWRDVRAPAIFPVWWTLWLISSWLGQASFRIEMRADEPAERILGAVVMLLSDAIDLPLALVALGVVARIWAAQNLRRADAE